jgi:AAA family ATP:ADP antiporter
VGLTVLLMSVPVAMTIGYALVALAPSFVLVVGVLAARRIGDYGISRPCRDSLYTVVTREEKYKAKSLIDTFVYRGGDASSAALYKALTAGLGAGISSVCWLGAAISALWALLSFGLGRAQQARSRSADAGGTAGAAAAAVSR